MNLIGFFILVFLLFYYYDPILSSSSFWVQNLDGPGKLA